MLAKAAANASVPSIKGAIYLDSHDVKIIQYKAALYKLIEMSRLLNVLEKSLEKPTGSTIIPLINYILILFEGPLFNVHPVLRKRFQLLCMFKVCKTVQINPALNTNDLSLSFELPPVNEDIDSLRDRMYDKELQHKLLGCLRSVVNNSMSLYERKLRQIQIERNARRPTDSLGRPIPFDIASVEDILRARESSLCLDLAVLINNREEDTSLTSMHKLQIQVLNKFLVSYNTKLWPVMKNYYLQLKKFAATKGNLPATLKELQHWEYTMHRIYALLLRSLYLYGIGISLARQIYYPNKAYLNAPRTKLLSENVFAYEESLSKVEAICASLDDQEIVSELLNTLKHYGKQGSTYHVQHRNIIEFYQTSISKIIPNMNKSYTNLETFCTMWKYIESSNVAAKPFEDKTEEQLNKLLTERRSVDKLTHVEKLTQNQKKTSPLVSSSLSDSANPSRSSLKRSGTNKINMSTNTSVYSSACNSPGKISPLMARSDSMEKSSSKFSIYGSPQVSRRGSISENRTNNYSSVIPKNSTDHKNLQKSPLSNAKRVGRPRSSSLQSPLDDKRNPGSISSLHSRSNSLQAEGIINQKIVQNKLHYPTSNDVASEHKKNFRPSPLQSRMKTSISSTDLEVHDEQTTEHSDNSSLSSELAALSMSNENSIEKLCGNQKQGADSPVGSENTVVPEETVCIKKVRFSGVPPMSAEEKRSPSKKGWYKKPTILHYPPPPPAIVDQKYRLRQEGFAFRTSLRETNNDSKKTSMLMSMDIPPTKESATQRLTSKLRDKLR